MKKNIYFFDGFPVAGMRKKMIKKKKNSARSWNGLMPFSQFKSRYNFCIMTQGKTAGWLGRRGLGHETASHAHDTAERKARYSRQRARGAWLGDYVAIQ